MNDLALRQSIIDELGCEPSVDAANIGVAVEEGVVTLSGHVGWRHRLAGTQCCGAAAWSIPGVVSVTNNLAVNG
ncbi:hypothetical protein ATY79_00305 [Rhizobium sp. R693]|nr:hypothetical protein ATY79_00305 [Rhizobium sp. R693]